MTALGNSVGTNGPLDAEIVRFSDFEALQSAPAESVRGKIVLLTRRMERRHDGSGYARVQTAGDKGLPSAAFSHRLWRYLPAQSPLEPLSL
ncbi:hypothetical protein [Variovorax guangxiensis]|uniref:hypothetical protein n=1 Tax=Variovorax guangxiensis TaxID=1775474 RepID=UPI0028598110|nr:hypothetical protein [Variovorax guangxiensis]MDR6861517.1 hypothetical protein [Variovorax guangxiensis]